MSTNKNRNLKIIQKSLLGFTMYTSQPYNVSKFLDIDVFFLLIKYITDQI